MKGIKHMSTAEIEAVVTKLESKIGSNFAIKCSRTGNLVKMTKKTFLNHVRKLDGDYAALVNGYVSREARKSDDCDFIGRAKVKKAGAAKLITISDLEA